MPVMLPRVLRHSQVDAVQVSSQDQQHAFLAAHGLSGDSSTAWKSQICTVLAQLCNSDYPAWFLKSSNLNAGGTVVQNVNDQLRRQWMS
jgi:hypothetical protein